jgi:hypothetical protein
MVDRPDIQEAVNTKTPHCDRCGKPIHEHRDVFRLDPNCIAQIYEEIALLRAANQILRHELEEKYGIVKTIYH